MTGPPSLDPLRYGLRALEEMAREQASVAPPPKTTEEVFAPHPILRTSLREGAAFSLRLFSEVAEDATSFVLGDDTTLRLEPIPARAATLFEAHAAVRASEGDETLTLGFPLVTFVQQGSARAAPLFSLGGARAAWSREGAPWKLPPDARAGVPMPLPDALELGIDAEAAYAVHGGVWHHLFGLDGAVIAEVSRAARGGLGALVRAATRAMESGGEASGEDGAQAADQADAGPLRKEDLDALCEAARRRAPPSRALRCFPLGMVMLPPRGDPTSALRTDLRALLEEPAPRRGALAVYLGADARPRRDALVWATGALPPTPSQLAAARAFEGSEDLVAVCGPPGCGKTALLHLVAAQTVVACALAGLWSAPPPRTTPWPLVVTSTNNAAVDTALAPFVSATEGIPLALRLGNRRSLAEVTGAALAAAMEALDRPALLPLADARALFDSRAKAARALLRAQADTTAPARREALATRAGALRRTLSLLAGHDVPVVPREALDEALLALREHEGAAARLAPLHLTGARASTERAAEKWARANDLRAPRVLPVLEALGIEAPFGPRDAARPLEDIARQRGAIEAALARVTEVRAIAGAEDARAELASVERELAALAPASPTFAPDPELLRAALALREAWARAHRGALVTRLSAALAATGEDRGAGRGKPLAQVLQELAPLFPLAGSTLLSMRACFPFGADVIDRLVVDEAAQCAPIYAVPALARARRAMLTGDVAQLPPVYTLDARADERVAKGLDAAVIAPFRMGAESTASAQAAAEPRARARLALVEHFRSQPAIVALASHWSGHRLEVRTPRRSLETVSPRLVAPVLVAPVFGTGERAPEGIVNEAEAERAVALALDLLEDGVAPSDLAVLTPFVGQSVRIERMLLERGLLDRERGGGVLVSTVHKLQGGERRVVIFSVTATASRHLRWLRERPHLLHVATSRARDHLLVLVSPDALATEPCLAPFATSG